MLSERKVVFRVITFSAKEKWTSYCELELCKFSHLTPIEVEHSISKRWSILSRNNWTPFLFPHFAIIICVYTASLPSRIVKFFAMKFWAKSWVFSLWRESEPKWGANPFLCSLFFYGKDESERKIQFWNVQKGKFKQTFCVNWASRCALYFQSRILRGKDRLYLISLFVRWGQFPKESGLKLWGLDLGHTFNLICFSGLKIIQKWIGIIKLETPIPVVCVVCAKLFQSNWQEVRATNYRGVVLTVGYAKTWNRWK